MREGYSKFNVACKVCGSPTRVTRTFGDGKNVRRERECTRGHKMETVEAPVHFRKRLTARQAAQRRWAHG